MVACKYSQTMYMIRLLTARLYAINSTCISLSRNFSNIEINLEF